MQNRHYIGKFYIEKNKLKDNLLSIKYSKNEAPHSQLRPRSISTALRGLVEDVRPEIRVAVGWALARRGGAAAGAGSETEALFFKCVFETLMMDIGQG